MEAKSMIKKTQNPPIQLLMEEALLRWLPPHHKKREEIRQSSKKIKAGYRGEQDLNYYLSFLPGKDYSILHNVRLSHENRFFQIDTLILTPNSAYIIESKNFYGHLYYNTRMKRMIHTFNGEKEGFPDPLLQATRQKIQLHRWMAAHKIKPIPIHCLVSLGNNTTIFETDRDRPHIAQQILHAEHIPAQIVAIQQSQQASNNNEPALSAYRLQKLTELLLEKHTPQSINILRIYDINPAELLLGPGVPCPKCTYQLMTRRHSKWDCPNCRMQSKTAHREVIEDYILIHGSITNRECRDLLKIDNIQVVKRILNQMNLSYRGSFKDRTYYRQIT
jgi:hypothetical protein